ncbi:hypothetical protein GOP47_0018324 [Adiantum capillus-veneris]|uniref:Uncharacterized protein n=1 Tax=Adiantum capillus-veneris TaxID=13818 RepID=A0A9D4ZCN7_ADICA|nr:hypothetical protein GOP47_0018324 [Adiantum capillus-veneris]
MVLKVALQLSLYRLPRFFEEDYAMESSLAGEKIMRYGGDASQVGLQACSMYEASVWIQGIEDRCYDSCTQCHVFDPGRVYTILGRAYGFSFDPGRLSSR